MPDTPSQGPDIIVTGARLPRLHASVEALSQLKREETGGKMVGNRLVLLPLGEPALKAYRCPAGVWTIGWGVTGKDVFEGVTCTLLEAEVRFEAEVQSREAALRAILGNHATSGQQFDALLLLAFNIGIPALAKSSLMRKHLAGNWEGAACSFDSWVYATVGGKKVKLDGLVERRDREEAMYRRGIVKEVALLEPQVSYGGVEASA